MVLGGVGMYVWRGGGVPLRSHGDTTAGVVVVVAACRAAAQAAAAVEAARGRDAGLTGALRQKAADKGDGFPGLDSSRDGVCV